jgi:hypothetical protein
MYQRWGTKNREEGARDYHLEQYEEKLATLGHLHPQFRYIHKMGQYTYAVTHKHLVFE